MAAILGAPILGSDQVLCFVNLPRIGSPSVGKWKVLLQSKGLHSICTLRRCWCNLTWPKISMDPTFEVSHVVGPRHIYSAADQFLLCRTEVARGRYGNSRRGVVQSLHFHNESSLLWLNGSYWSSRAAEHHRCIHNGAHYSREHNSNDLYNYLDFAGQILRCG